MIEKFGIGIDIADITKFECISFSEKSEFYKKIFLQSEIDYCLKFKNPYERFAGKFAIKEAAIKSIDEKVHVIDIETFHKNSKPSLRIPKINNKYDFLVSLSHDQKMAVAVVISEKL